MVDIPLITRNRRRARAYKDAFLGGRGGGPNLAGAEVLADLRRFCHDTRTTARVSPVTGTLDPVAMALAEGRREVWLRIQQFLQLDETALAQLTEQEGTYNG
ncbi:hypothetical protein [Zavarzinia aquatilis]|uniref:Bbp19-like phage domain-containing protein n=1 Tax=Zavarzinia aquatilis TaxID=2211142 RepID=A0A317EFB1_9PROT|nr:hypothetical protein [Zavarzinia aquatilis]PWR24976.1 hypothetical protein DKG74_04195 [Zavarzinia aquatilis]